MMLLLLSSLSACSGIFEDRSECPCRVILDLSDVPETVSNLYIWRYDEKGFYDSPLKIARKEFTSDYRMDVRRSAATRLYIWGNIIASNLAGLHSDTILVSRYMVVTDRLWSDNLCSDTRRDSIMYKLALKKDYSTIYLHMDGTSSSEAGIGLALHQSLLSYHVSGTPHWGNVTIPLSVDFNDDQSITSVFNILRGKVDDSLFIEVIIGDGHKYTLPLWIYLNRYGYDVDKDNLDDVVLWLDPSFNCSSVDICPWQDVPGGTLLF